MTPRNGEVSEWANFSPFLTQPLSDTFCSQQTATHHRFSSQWASSSVFCGLPDGSQGWGSTSGGYISSHWFLKHKQRRDQLWGPCAQQASLMCSAWDGQRLAELKTSFSPVRGSWDRKRERTADFFAAGGSPCVSSSLQRGILSSVLDLRAKSSLWILCSTKS